MSDPDLFRAETAAWEIVAAGQKLIETGRKIALDIKRQGDIAAPLEQVHAHAEAVEDAVDEILSALTGQPIFRVEEPTP